MRGRGWNRGNYPGGNNNNNSSNGNPANMNPQGRPPEEEWDPEYTPKSRKYYLVSRVDRSWLLGITGLGNSSKFKRDFCVSMSFTC